MSSEYTKFEGILFPKCFTMKNLKVSRDEFVVKDTDVVVVTYPKSGTHWVIEIVSLIRSKGDNTWVQSIPIWNRSPWIETDQGQLLLSKKEQNGPRFYSSHLPIQLFPKSYFHSKAKIIYVIRNPKDVMVSFYHFTKLCKFYETAESFSQAFEKFTQGTVPFGSWFDHTRGWLPLREKENFLILTYEELLQDLRGNVDKICHFLGTTLTEEEINLVIKNSSFSAMKANNMCNHSILSDEWIDNSQGNMLRKGIAGDWKNHFTVAQSEAFDKLFQERMAELDQRLFPWEQ
ncbi:sulfotransferase 2A1-like [Phascolarctos cinereus]|uniref:Sulfotransferase n=1 Tax=Phascolarctos cinereus TaxID=38626 RepID=A0A6P5LMU4_PHACI|nr:bile salt sulfotransferase-like [Phascolarctos cinereus]